MGAVQQALGKSFFYEVDPVVKTRTGSVNTFAHIYGYGLQVPAG